MYNTRFKQEFLKSHEGTSVIPVYSALFNKSQKIEGQVEKDLYDFNMRDIELLYYEVNTPSVKTLEVFHSLTIKYVNYAYATREGLRESDINLFENISCRELERFIATYKHQYLTKEEFEEFMQYVVNGMDVAMYRALFEGISGASYSELINLKYEDLYYEDGRYYAHLTENKVNETLERTIEISSQLYKDLCKSHGQSEYLTNNGETEVMESVEIVSSEYIFRPQKRGAYTKSDGKVNNQFVYRRKTLLNELTDEKIKNTNTIILSGMLHYANTIYEAKGTLSDGDLLAIAKRFNKATKSQYQSQIVKNIKNKLRQGLKERYSIEI